jgi:lysophospholipase L1-like esterase
LQENELMKILFQGDSITDAFRKPEEINPAFQLGNGYAFLLGALYPDERFEFVNRGVSGNSIEHLAQRWQRDALDLRPDLLSLLIGVNNCYRSLLESLRIRNPGIQFILLEPFLAEAGDVTIERKSRLRAIQQGIGQISKEYDASFVPLQQIFDQALSGAPAASWSYDGVHASHAGFQLLADAWLEAAESHRLCSEKHGVPKHE